MSNGMPSSNGIPDPCKAGDPRPDLANIEILYCGNLADDDFMWIVECTPEELFKMLEAPLCWVYNLAEHPNWKYFGSNEKAPPAVLLENFTMQLEELEVKEGGATTIVVQGISLTGILTVRASQSTALKGLLHLESLGSRIAASAGLELEAARALHPQQLAETVSGNWLSEYWTGFVSDPAGGTREFAVNVDLTNNYWYGHLRIYDPQHDDPQMRSTIIATHLLAKVADPVGYVQMLSELEQTVILLDNGTARSGDPITLVLPATDINFLYSSSGASVEEGCDMIRGPFVPQIPPAPPTTGTGTTSTSTVKDYAPIPVPPPEP